MARRKKTIANETLSQEKPEVQEALLKEVLTEDPKAGTVKIPKVDPKTIKDYSLKVGDKVKLNPDVGTDMLGRRIHNGIRNYTYNVLAVRDDGYVSIECLTYAFLVKKTQLNKI